MSSPRCIRSWSKACLMSRSSPQMALTMAMSLLQHHTFATAHRSGDMRSNVHPLRFKGRRRPESPELDAPAFGAPPDLAPAALQASKAATRDVKALVCTPRLLTSRSRRTRSWSKACLTSRSSPPAPGPTWTLPTDQATRVPMCAHFVPQGDEGQRAPSWMPQQLVSHLTSLLLQRKLPRRRPETSMPLSARRGCSCPARDASAPGPKLASRRGPPSECR